MISWGDQGATKVLNELLVSIMVCAIRPIRMDLQMQGPGAQPLDAVKIVIFQHSTYA